MGPTRVPAPALAKRIVEQHGSTITLDSRPDDGCRFTIRLPLSPTPAGDSDSEGV